MVRKINVLKVLFYQKNTQFGWPKLVTINAARIIPGKQFAVLLPFYGLGGFFLEPGYSVEANMPLFHSRFHPTYDFFIVTSSALSGLGEDVVAEVVVVAAVEVISHFLPNRHIRHSSEICLPAPYKAISIIFSGTYGYV